MRCLALRALLLSVLLCGLVLVLGLFRGSLFVVLWWFWFPGIAVVAYPSGMSGFDLELHPWSALFVVLVDVLFWWVVMDGLIRRHRVWRNRLGTQ
jgi:hypothetical protein